MTHRCKIFVVSLLALGTAATPALAQRERNTPRGAPVPWDPEPPAVAKSDEHRVVGKVLEIDREKRMVKLETEEGVRVVPAPPMTLAAIREGDVISVPRSPDAPVNSLPRQTPPRR